MLTVESGPPALGPWPAAAAATDMDLAPLRDAQPASPIVLAPQCPAFRAAGHHGACGPRPCCTKAAARKPALGRLAVLQSYLMRARPFVTLPTSTRLGASGIRQGWIGHWYAVESLVGFMRFPKSKTPATPGTIRSQVEGSGTAVRSSTENLTRSASHRFHRCTAVGGAPHQPGDAGGNQLRH